MQKKIYIIKEKEIQLNEKIKNLEEENNKLNEDLKLLQNKEKEPITEKIKSVDFGCRYPSWV